MEKNLIEKAKSFSEQTGKPLSKLVADYFQSLTEGKSKAMQIGSKTKSLRGLLKGSSSPKDDYKNFIVELDFKMGEGRVDTGVFLRDSKEQIQIGESGSLKRDMTALPYIPKLKGYPVQVKTAEEVFDKADWNTLKIQVIGNSYTTWLNGTEIMTYESETIVPEGPIGLQVHPKRDMTISFRNILATELPE